MKKFITALTLAFIIAFPLVGFGQADIEKDPAYLPIDKVLDLKAIQPTVNVNIPRFLLKDVVSNLNSNDLAANGIDLADLVKDVKLIRVIVIEAKKTNKAELDKAMEKLRAEAESKWTQIVKVQDNNDHVGVYAMGDPSGVSVAGVAVLVYDGNDAVIVNVVGHVSISKLIQIASKSNKFPKDLLKQLQGAGIDTGTKPSAKADKGAGEATTNAPAEAPHAAPNDSDKK